MPFPIRHESHILEHKSENFLKSHIPQEWVVNRPENDYCADLQLGISEDGELRGLELIIQLKAEKKVAAMKILKLLS